MLNLSGKTYVMIIIFGIVLLTSGCGYQDGDIEPIEPKAETVLGTAIPTPAVEKTTALVSPISPVSPLKESAMPKNGDVMEPTKGSEKALAAAIADLAEQADVSPDEISLALMEAVEWSDSSLGCPQEGFMYAQVITPGYLIVLEAEGKLYSYHTDQDGTSVVLCEEK